jgi:hypothetical protein
VIGVIGNLVNVDWINQFNSVQQFAAGLAIGAIVIMVSALLRRRKGRKNV